MDDRIKGMIEKKLETVGYHAEAWKDTDDGPTAVLGRFKVIEENEDQGLYMDDEGEVTACVVGAPQYGNERVHFTFTPEGYDSGTEADLFSLDPITY